MKRKRISLFAVLVLSICTPLFADEQVFYNKFGDFSVWVFLDNFGHVYNNGTVFYSNKNAVLKMQSDDNSDWPYDFFGDSYLYNAAGTLVASMFLNDTGRTNLHTLTEDYYKLIIKVKKEKTLLTSGDSREFTVIFKQDRQVPTFNFNHNTIPVYEPLKEIYTKNPSETCSAIATDALSGVKSVSSASGGAVNVNEKSVVQTFSTEGKHTFSVTATDNVNNTATQTQTVYIDWTDPVFSGMADSSGGTWVKEAMVTASATDGLSGIDGASWQYSLDGGVTWSEKGDSNNQVVVKSNGIHTVQFKVSDKAGNTAVSQKKTVKIDAGIPEIKISAPDSDKWVKTALVKATASDSLSGIKTDSLAYSIDGGGTWSSGTEVALTSSGIYEVQFKATDKAGNTEISQKKTVKIDATKPVISVTNPAGAGWVSSVTVSASAIDAHAGMDETSWQYSTDGGTTYNAGKSVPLGSNGPDNAPYRVVFKASDKIGNETVTEEVLVRIDTSVPKITVSGYPAEESVWVNGERRLSAVSSSIPSGVESGGWSYTDDGGKTFQPGDSYRISQEESGIYIVGFKVKTNAGVYGYSELKSIRVDNENPVITISSSSGNQQIVQSCTFSAAATDAYSGIAENTWKYAVDGGTKQTGNSVTISEHGVHAVEFFVTDNAGNTTSVSKSIQIDIEGPVIEVLKDPVAEWAQEVNIRAMTENTDLDATSWNYEITYAGNPVRTGSGDSVTLTEEGAAEVCFYAQDTLGNKSKSRAVAVKIDRSVPVFRNEYTLEGNVLTVQADDADSGIDTTTYRYRQGTSSVYTSGQSAVLPDGKDIDVRFTVSDKAGNVSSEKNFTLTVDTVSPILSCSVAPYMRNDELSLIDFTARDETTGLKRLSYQLDDSTDWIPLAVMKESYQNELLSVSIGTVGEGVHTVRIKAEDFYGNATETERLRIIADKTPPYILDTTEFACNGKLLVPHDFIGTQPLQITVRAADTYDDRGKTETGIITEWHVGVSVREGIPPEEWSVRQSNVFVLNDKTIPLNGGIHYVYVRAVDGSGNISEPVVRELIKDTATPGKPVITSGTHRKANKVTETELSGAAVFSARPQSTAEAGISGYKWQLQTCRDSGGTDTAIRPYGDTEYLQIAETGILTLSFNLPDNEEDEFYRLEVFCLGGNGIESSSSVFRFRVDSTPPEGLSVSISPQTDNESWYNAADARIRWNKPADKTGIAKYIVRISDGDGTVLKTEPTNSNEYQLSVTDLMEESGEKQVTVSVEAVDYSGNTILNSRSFKIDREKPVFTTELRTEPFSNDRESGCVVSWGDLQDTVSGSDYITLQLTGLSQKDTSSRNIILSGNESEYTFKTLKTDAAYHVTVKGFDSAGNFAILNTDFTTGNAQMPETIRILYDENVNGYRITGTLERSAGKEILVNGRIDIPNTLDIRKMDIRDGMPEETAVSFFKFDDELTVLSDSLVNGARSVPNHYVVVMDGFEIHGKELHFDRNNGLILSDVSYIRKIFGNDGYSTDYTVQFENAKLGFPYGASIRTPIAVQKTTVGVLTAGFDIANVREIGISGSKELLSNMNGGLLSFTPEKIDLRTADGSRSIPLQPVSVNGDGTDVAAKVGASDIVLRMSGTEFTVIHSGISGSRYEVYEAVLELPEGYQVADGGRRLVLKNFYIDDSTGLVSEGEDFSSGTVSYLTADGREISIETISLGSDGTVYGAGRVDAGVYGSLSMTELILTNTGADFENGCPVNGFETLIHGFLIKADSVKYTGSGMFIEEGTILLYGTGRNIRNLGLDISARNRIYRTGLVESVFEADTGYGAPVIINKVSVERDGVFAGAIEIPLPYENAHTWQIDRTQLYGDGSCSAHTVQPMRMSLGGFGLIAEDTDFNGKKITLNSVSVLAGEPFNAETLLITGVSFNALQLEDGGKLTEEQSGAYRYAFDGWNYRYADMRIAEDGIHGMGFITAYEELSGNGWIIEFDDFTVKADQSIVSGSGSAKGSACIWYKDGHKIRLPAAIIEKDGNGTYILTCEKPEISLAPYVREPLYLGKTQLAADGTVVTSEKGNGTVFFTSSNNYSVRADSVELRGKEILLSGGIKAEQWNGYAQTEKNGITLLPRAAVEFTDAQAQITYSYKGWKVSGKGIQFLKNEAGITSNVVVYRGQKIELGALQFTPKGVLKAERKEYQQTTLPLVTERTQLTETTVDAAGITGAITVELAEQFGGRNIPYRNVRLYQDGSFSPVEAINHISIDLGAVMFDLNYINLTEDGLEISEASIILPDLDNATVKLRGVSFGNDGRMSLKGAATSAFTLWNMTFRVIDLSVENNEISIEGSVTLPKSLPGILSERTVGIRKMRIGLDGQVREFEARLEGQYVVPFLENWALKVTGVGIGYAGSSPYIGFDEAGLIFPSGFIVDSVVIDNVVFDPVKQNFDFERIKADTSIHMEKCGISFDLTQLSIRKDMTVGFSGSASFTAEQMPSFLKGKSVIIDTFEIKKDGSFGDISIELDGLNGEILPGLKALELRDGSVRVEKNTSGNLYVSVSGGLEFTAAAPEFVRNLSENPGTALLIEKFRIDTSIPEITDFSARLSRKMDNGTWSTDPAEINFDPTLFGTRLNDIAISFDWKTETGVISLEGGLILPDSLPQGMAGSEIRLQTFEIGMDGSIKSFGASYVLDNTNLAALDLTDIDLAAVYKTGTVEFDVGATVTLPETVFPEGIGGTTTAARFVFTHEQLKTVEARCSIPDRKLMGSLQMHGVSIALDKQYGKDLLISVAGGLSLPSDFPQGLAGTDVVIRDFTISADGKIQNIDIGAEHINAVVFNGLKLSEGRIDFSNGSENDFEINVQGQLAFISQSMPEGLKNATFSIDELRFSTKTGLKKFSAGMHSSLNFTVLNGLDCSVQKLEFSESGFSIAAAVRLNLDSVAFANTEFALRNFEMDWSGNIVDIQGGLKRTDISIAGFAGSISELYVLKDEQYGFMIALKECRIVMPDNFGSNGGSSVALKNATFNPDTGAFNGDIEVPQLTTEIAGFTLLLDAPTINFQKGRIDFSRVALKMPEFMKSGEVSLYNVEISAANGFRLGGGGFMLPDFKVGEIGFYNIGAEFVMEGNTYMISGHGGAMIPGAGIIEAKLSFTDVSSTYPIGLKHAYFSYESYFGGIPLGTTGLCLSGIRGGLAYGEPDDVPERYRKLFHENGARIQLGLTVKDQGGGKLVHMSADTWIDMTKVAWVLEGNTTLLSGTLNITAKAAAIVSSNVFATGMDVRILFIRGTVEIYIFDHNGSLKFSGSSVVQFGMPEAYLYDGIWINIPSSDIWFGSIGALFGDFTNGRRGFLGYIDINIGRFLLGRVGAFIGTGGLDIRVSSYQILKPEGIDLFGYQRSVNAPSVYTADRERLRETGNTARTYRVIIPGATTVPSGLPDPIMASPLRSVSGNFAALSTASQNAGVSEAPERVIFLVEYLEGDPDFTIVSPSGIVYKGGDATVETAYCENGMFVTVQSPESGEWKLTMDNIDEGSYGIAVFGVEKIPEITVTEPSSGTTIISETMYVSGTTDEKHAEIAVFAAIDELQPAFEVGKLKADGNGNYAGQLSAENLADGEYVISARVVLPDGLYSPAAVSGGKYKIDRSLKDLKAPIQLRAAETDEGTVTLSWKNTNGARTAGYYLSVTNENTGAVTKEAIGNVTNLRIGGYEAGRRVSYTVSTYDTAGKESEATYPVSLIIGTQKPDFNSPQVLRKTVEIGVTPGETATGSVPVRIENRYGTSDSFSYILARRLADERELPIDVTFAAAAHIENTTVSVPFSVYAEDSCPAGMYTVLCEVVNEGNGKLSDTFAVTVAVENPVPEIVRIEPGSISGLQENALSIFGNGFVPGTRYYFDGTEISVTGSGSDGLSLKTVKIPPTAERGLKTLTVTGPDGKSASAEIPVRLPDWSVSIYTTKASVRAGEKAAYPIAIRGLDGFSGKASFTVEKTESGFSVSVPELYADERGFVYISVPETCVAGTYTTIISGGERKTYTLTTVVTAEPVTPVVTSVTPGTGYAGTEITVFGYGFGSTGSLYWNNTELAVSSWSDYEITAVLPASLQTGRGKIRVKTGAFESNAVTFTIRNSGFSIRSGTDVITLNANGSVSEQLFVNGYAENITLSAIAEPDSPFSVRLDTYELVPNGVVRLLLTAAANAPNGSWNVVIRGSGSSYTDELQLTVTIRDSFTITTDALPNGSRGLPYRMQLEYAHTAEKVYWKQESGSLPKGLTLSSDGKISGTPVAKGSYAVGIKAYTESGTETTGEYVLYIGDDIWSRRGKDGGKTNCSVSDVPSTDTVYRTVRAEQPITDIYVHSRRIVLVSRGMITVLDENARLFWTDKNSYTESFINENVFVGLDTENKVTARSLTTGLVVWDRSGVEKMWFDGNILVTKESEVFYILDTDTGTVKETKTELFGTNSEILWHNGCAWEVGNDAINGVYGNAQTWKSPYVIRNAACDAEGFVVLTANAVILLDNMLNETGRIERILSEQAIAGMDSTGIFVLDGTTVTEYDRKTLEAEWSRTGVKEFAAANEKAIITEPERLEIINRYSGRNIWETEGNVSAIAVYDTKLYVARGTQITVYDGEANARAPETGIRYTIAENDGTNGWYKTPPKMYVDSTDAETYVAEIRYRQDGENWNRYDQPISIGEGYTRFEAYALDSRDLKSSTVSSQIKVDATAPVSSAKLSAAQNAAGWYETDVYVSIAAYDGLSGIAYVKAGNKTYAGTIVYKEEGEHKLTVQAVDKAGNKEAERELVIRIDKYEPTVSADIRNDVGITVVTLNAEDSGSGVDYVEYRIDDGRVNVYSTPVVLLEKGPHKVEYRAKDISGRQTSWKTVYPFVNGNTVKAGLLGLAEVNGDPRSVCYPLQEQMELYAKERSMSNTGKGNENQLTSLPEYAKGGTYVQWKESDKDLSAEKTASCYVKEDAVVYMFAAAGSTVAGEWSSVEKRIRINEKWFPEGCDVYMRRAEKGDCIVIAEKGSKSVLPLIVVQEKAELKSTLGIRIKDETHYLECIVTPVTQAASLPLRYEWYIETNAGKELQETNGIHMIRISDTMTGKTVFVEVKAADGTVETICSRIIVKEPGAAR